MINGDLADQKYPLEKLPEELQGKYQDMLPGIDSYTNQITLEISRESLHDALVILKASEVGYSIDQLVNDQVTYNTSKDILNLDLTVAALNKFADTHDLSLIHI